MLRWDQIAASLAFCSLSGTAQANQLAAFANLFGMKINHTDLGQWVPPNAGPLTSGKYSPSLAQVWQQFLAGDTIGPKKAGSAAPTR